MFSCTFCCSCIMYIYLIHNICYKTTGIGGNIFSTLTTPSAISVGSGGSVFGILGAINIEMMHSLVALYFAKNQDSDCDDDDDDDDDGYEEVEEEECEKNGSYDNDEYQEDLFIFHSTFIILGFLGGIMITTLIGFISPTNSAGFLAKDWSVLYGGMISGMIVGLIMYLFELLLKVMRKEKKINTNCWKELVVMVLIIIPFFLDCFFSLQLTRMQTV